MFHFANSSGEDVAVTDFTSEDRSPKAPRGIYAAFGKRILDVLIVLAAMPVALPLMGIFALLVRRDGGPAFFAQERVGRDGRLFTCWKLRSMVVDADARLTAYLEETPEAKAEWEVTQKLKHDPRITPVGRFIRKSSIDELPQLFCILRGDMSLVGPRPFLPEQRELYHGQAYYRLRPGLTGPWQVGDRNESSFAARVGFDNRYEAGLSFATDLGVLFRTVGVVLKGTGV